MFTRKKRFSRMMFFRGGRHKSVPPHKCKRFENDQVPTLPLFEVVTRPGRGRPAAPVDCPSYLPWFEVLAWPGATGRPALAVDLTSRTARKEPALFVHAK
jgi:hypothetical protein